MERKAVQERRVLAAIMFTDIQGFTERMNRRESMGFRLLRKHNDTMDAAVSRYGGRVVKSMGDSYMIAFDSVVNAVQCALEAQEEFDRINRTGGLPEPLLVRISIHLGDVVIQGKDVFGDGVNLASHLQQVTPGGAICVSQEVYSQVRGKISGGDFKNLGFCRIKGLPDPIEVFQVFNVGGKSQPATPVMPRPVTAVVKVRKIRSRAWLVAAGASLCIISILAWMRHKTSLPAVSSGKAAAAPARR